MMLLEHQYLAVLYIKKRIVNGVLQDHERLATGNIFNKYYLKNERCL